MFLISKPLSRAALFLATLAVWPTLQVQAAIAPGSTGNGELFLSVFDPVNKVSYAKDLGITMDDFLAAAQVEAGLQRYFVIDDALWTSFLALTDPTRLRWAVNAFDATGNASTAGTQRLLTSVRQGQEGQRAMTVNRLVPGLGSTQAGTFFNGVNASSLFAAGQSTHAPTTVDSSNYTIHGSSYSRESDNGRGYYGEAGGTGPSLNGNASFTFDNPVGQSSWFYLVTNAGGSQLNPVLIDEFDNLGHDGYWGLTLVDKPEDASSPYFGKYLLSYTLPASGLTAAAREFAASWGRTAFSGGFTVSLLDPLASEREAPARLSSTWLGSTLPLQDVPLLAVASPVPEPAAWLSMGLGLSALWAWRRQHGRRAASPWRRHTGHGNAC